MNLPDINEVKTKLDRILQYFESSGYEAMIIGRQDNFAWLTDGGNNRVIIPSEAGFGLLIITRQEIFLVAQVMDGPRIMEEELAGLNFTYVPLYWYEASREETALELVKGKKTISDLPLNGTAYLPKEIYQLHYPLTDREVQKLRWLGQKTEEVITKIAYELEPGLPEFEIEAMLLYELGKYNIQADVLLVGSDERIFQYRHPNPTHKAIHQYILLHPVARKWGLHANVTRLVYLGDDLSQEITRKYYAACQIEAAALSMCRPEIRFCDILAEQKRLYQELGFPEEWRNHYQGGITGYMVADPTLNMDPKNVIQPKQAYDWFITITGVKVEELSINNGKEVELLSVCGGWPTKTYAYHQQRFDLPAILMR